MAITPSDFSKIWASNADTPEYTFTEANYLKGWDFVGNLPPTRAMWNAMQKSTDEKMKYVFDNFGAPLIAPTIADMTLQNRVYVYTGSEVGYTAGDWYYYDAGTSTWVDGGVYNAVAFNTDPTLTISGAAADAKVTGDKFNNIDNAIFLSTGNKDYSSAFVNGVYYTYSSTADISAPLNSNTVKCIVVDCVEGDVFSVKGHGGQSGRLWAFLGADSGGTRPILQNSSPDATASDYIEILAPENAEKLVVNVNKSYAYGLVVGRILQKEVDSLGEIAYKTINPTNVENGFIAYSTGQKNNTTAAKIYTYAGSMPKKVRAFISSNAPSVCAIAFYNTTTISTASYMQADSVPNIDSSSTLSEWYEADVPALCKMIVFTSLNASGSVPAPIFKFSIDRKDEVGKLSPNLFAHDRFIYHYNMSQVSTSFNPLTDTETIIIPSQSVYDIQIASRLGFKFIELNCQKTSDGKYVVTHGLAGALGYDINEGVYDADTDTFTVTGSGHGTLISSITFDVLRTNYRYRSIYAKYRTPICSLEEALTECKICGITPFFGYIDDESLNITKEYFGEDFILYQGNNLYRNLRDKYNGLIFDWFDGNGYATVDSLVEASEKIGYPCIIGIGKAADMESSGILDDAIKAIHKTQNYVLCAYQGKEKTNLYTQMGVDCFSTTNKDVNDFCDGNIANLHGDIDFDGFEYPNGALNDGVISLSNGQRLKVVGSIAGFLVKEALRVKFKGELLFEMSFGASWNETSDGVNDNYYSFANFNRAYGFSLKAVGDVKIYSAQYYASKC